MDLENRIIEFLDNNAPKLALATKEQGTKVQIVDENGKQGKLNVKLIQVRHGLSNLNDFRHTASELKGQIGAVCEEIDAELIWEEVSSGTNDGASADELAALYFGQSDSLRNSAIFRKLYADGIRFRFKNNEFFARDANEIAAEKASREKAQIRDKQIRTLRKFLRQVHQAGSILDVPEELSEVMQKLEAGFLLGHANEAFDLLKALGFDQPVEELAFDILVKTGRISPGSDEILKVAGIERTFNAELLEHAAGLTEFTDGAGREDFSHLLSFSIDDDDTREVDDAISVEEKEGRIIVGVHIADLACFVSPKDPVDEEALRRCATIYMPTGPILMIPDKISCDLASLNCGELRPSFTTMIEFSHEGEILDWRICRGLIKVQHRLNYEQADELIQSSDGDLGFWLNKLTQLCAVNTRKRLDAGSIIFSKTEHKVRVTDKVVTAAAFKTDTDSRNLISELMILCNSLTAEFAQKNEIPLIFRAQVPPDDPARKYRGCVVKDTNPNVFRGLKKGRLSLIPQPHSGLGLQSYTQISSPLRRFGDLVMQRQIAAFLEGKTEYPYTANELMEVIGNAETVERESKLIERRSTRFWELEYIRQLEQTEFTATVMSKIAGAYIVAAYPIPVRGKMMAGDTQLPFGEKVRVAIDKLIPELSVFRLKYLGPVDEG